MTSMIPVGIRPRAELDSSTHVRNISMIALIFAYASKHAGSVSASTGRAHARLIVLKLMIKMINLSSVRNFVLVQNKSALATRRLVPLDDNMVPKTMHFANIQLDLKISMTAISPRSGILLATLMVAAEAPPRS